MSAHKFFLKRAGTAAFLLFLLPFLTFILMRLMPGNYFDSLRMDPRISQATVESYEKLYRLNEPVGVQYLYWLGEIFKGNLGYSFAYKQPVLNVLWSRLGNTILLTGVSFLWAWILAIFAGVLSARFPKSIFNRFFETVSYFALSIPGFFLCLLLLHAAATWTNLPLGGMRSVAFDTFDFWAKVADILRHLLIPSFVLGISMFAFCFRLVRSQASDNLSSEFILYLRAARVSERKILFKHIARHAINPLISLFGMQLPALVSGSALVEIFTGWPGLGTVMLQAVRSQDQFLVLGNILLISILLVLGNVISDVFLGVADPRIRRGSKSP